MRRLSGKAVIPQYQLMVGGRLDSEAAHFGRRASKIPARRVTQALERLLEWYRDNRHDHETASHFFAHAHVKDIEALLADLCEITPADAQPDDYIDIGEDHAFTGETKDGECAA